jgi:4-aminobutyrate aminotransferase
MTEGAESSKPEDGPLAPRLMQRDRAILTRSQKVRLYPFVLGRAEGTRLWDVDGREYVDWTSAGCVANVGYSDPRVRSAIEVGLDGERFGVLACHVNQPALELAERLVSLLPGEFAKKVWFGLAGAMDCVAKLAPLAAGRPRMVCFVGGFAGSSLGASGISGHHSLARPVGPGHVTKAPYPHPYRCPWGPCDQSECSLRCLRYLEQDILGTISPAEDTAAIVIEAIQSDNGEVVPPDNYLPALRELCDRHGIWLIFDEIKTGYGRTGRMFAFEHAGIEADAVGLGKPMAGGMPLSAVVGRAEILEGPVYMTHTLAGAPVSCRAGLAVLDVLEQDGLFERATQRGRRLREGLEELAARYPLIGDVRGRGLILGAELVCDRESRAPATRDAARLAYRCFELGLLVLYCGRHGNVIEITPPLITSEPEIDHGLALFERAVDDISRGQFDDKKLQWAVS